MHENESGSGGGWPEPPDHTGARTAHDEDEATQDTIALGGLAGQDGGPGQGSYVQHGSPDPWYGRDRGEPRYGRYAGPGSGSGSGAWGAGGSGTTGEGGSGGGYGSGAGGWDPGPPQQPRRRGRLLVYLTVAALAAVVGAGLTVAFDRPSPGPAAGISPSDVPSPHDNAGSSSALNQAAVKRKVVPGLVDITALLTYASETAEGTGMVLSSSGLVLTNNHVIDGATSVKVSLADNPGRTYTAQVMGYDRADDVALLQLTGASGLATVSFGNSSQVRIGTPVLALGDAGGRGRVTPTLGEISGLNRSIQASDEGSGTVEDLNHMLQTSAQIQQGDSGGALANNAGQVIGMVTAASTGPGGQPGGAMGFAIPINTALAIARLIADGRSSSTVSIGLPGFLGVEVAQSSSTDPRQQAADQRQSGNGPFGGPGCVADGQQPGPPDRIAPAGSGALILGVLCGTPAQSQGLAPGDVIVSVNGQPVTTPGSLTNITAEYHPGEAVSVGWEGVNGSRHTVRITLSDGPAR